MNKQSGNKVTKTDVIDKSKKPSAAPTNNDELSEQDLDKASGGTIGLGLRKSSGGSSGPGSTF